MKFKKDNYLARFQCRICFLLTGVFLFSIFPIIIMKADGIGIHSGIVWWKGAFFSTLISCYLFCKMFFIEIDKEPKQQKRLKASRIILYVIVIGLQIVIGSSYLMIKLYNSEEMFAFNFILTSILWVFSIIIAVSNKNHCNSTDNKPSELNL